MRNKKELILIADIKNCYCDMFVNYFYYTEDYFVNIKSLEEINKLGFNGSEIGILFEQDFNNILIVRRKFPKINLIALINAFPSMEKIECLANNKVQYIFLGQNFREQLPEILQSIRQIDFSITNARK